MSRLFGVTGWSGAGKTTLLVAVLPLLIKQGLRVSTLKQAHAGFDIDRPGKDSHRHRVAGAAEVMVVSPRRWALMHEYQDEPEEDMAALLSHFAPVDLVLIEGFRAWSHPKVEVYRPSLGRPPLYPDDPSVVAVASDTASPSPTLPWLDLAAPLAVAEFIVHHCAL